MTLVDRDATKTENVIKNLIKRRIQATCKVWVTPTIEDNILRLDISVKNVPRMNEVQSRGYAGNIESHIRFLEYQSLPKVIS